MPEILIIDRTWCSSVCEKKSQPLVKNCFSGIHLNQGSYCTLSKAVKKKCQKEINRDSVELWRP
jgi:hypothetical protein